MKIAVCLSGQPRSARTALPSLMRYFNVLNPDYFCHVWRQNTWKNPDPSRFHEDEVDEEVFEFIRTTLNPRLMLISNPVVQPRPFESMFKSMAYANMLRRTYEYETDHHYDLVVKARYDLIFPAHYQFSPQTPLERTLYTRHFYRLPHEYRRLNFSDVLFYGDPWGMDIAADYVFAAPRATDVDLGQAIGPGTGLADYLFRNNVNCVGVSTNEVIVRKEAAHLDPVRDWEQIAQIHWDYYRR